MAYDAYVQGLALKRREVFTHQEKLAQSLERIYAEYVAQLRELGINFGQEKVLQSLSGGRNTRLWFNLRRGFFKNSSREQTSVLMRAYFRQQKAWKTKIWKALKLDPTQYNDWKSPIKCQIFVWEQAILDPDYSTSNYDPSSYKPGVLHYEDLRPAGFDDRNKPVNQIYRERDFYHFIKHFPCHPVFVPRELLMGQIWNSLYGIVRDMMVITLLGRDWFDGGDLAGLEAVTGTDFVASQKKFIPFHFPGISLDLFWDYLPANFDLEKFRKNQSDAPLAMYLFVFDHSRSKSHFMGLVTGKDRTPFLKNISSQLDEFTAQLENEKIRFSVLDFKHSSLQGAPNMDLVYLPQKGYQDLTQVPMNHETRLVQPQKIDQLTGFLNKNTGGYVWEGQDLLKFLKKAIGGRNSSLQSARFDSKPDLKTVLRAANLLGRTLTFTYSKKRLDGSLEDYVATVFSSKVFPGKGFLLSQSLAGFQAQVLGDQILLLVLMLLAAGFVMFMGNILSRKLVTPVLELSEKITRLASGKYDEQILSTRRDEIGDLVSGFNSMAENISERLFELRAIGTINLLMTHDYSRDVILKYILHLLCIRYSASFGFIGFFEDTLSRRPADYQIWDRARQDQDGVESRIESFLEHLDATRSPFEVLENSALSCFSETEDQGRETSVCGVLVLGGLPQDSFSHLSAIGGTPVIHLCEQAKTVVLKGLLDEVEADTLKGQQVQEGLMPSVEPDTDSKLEIGSCFKGARGLAGDYYDYLGFEDQAYVGFAIADVSGKGVGPALFGASARATLKILAEQSPQCPGVALEGLNERLCETQDSSLFLTIFYCVFDLNRNRIFYASAGHNKMLLVRKDGSIEHLSAKGVPVGLFAGRDYESKTDSIGPGDSLVLYTDGITELENPSGELFGLERLEEFCQRQISAKSDDWTASLWQELDQYRDGVALSDDVTCLRILLKDKKELEELSEL